VASADSQLALFVDVDNLCLAAQKAGVPFQLSALVQRLRREGRIMTARAYAHWPRWQRHLAEFQAHGFELLELPTDARNKNTADVQLALDALEMALSRVAPEAVVLVSGDRDFVPLVQKLKRYGIEVIGVGIEGTVSVNLQQSCDRFLFYENLLPQVGTEDGGQEAEGEHALSATFPLLCQVVRSLEQDGRPACGATVAGTMRRLDPTFDPSRYRMSFKELASRAAEAGMVRMLEREGTDFLLSSAAAPPEGAKAPVEPAAPQPAVLEYRFGTIDEAADSYRGILQANRVPLLPREQRRALVKALWKRLEAAGDEGMTIPDMIAALEAHALAENLAVPKQALVKIVYTLNLARCFSGTDNGARVVRHGEFQTVRLRLLVDAERALQLMDRTYVNSIRIYQRECPLIPEALALLLYEEAGETALREARAIADGASAAVR